MPRPRYRIHKARSGWYVYDTHTGAPVQTGLIQAGARQLADHLNRRNP